MTILRKRAKFYGTTTEELVQWLDKVNLDETIKVLQTYEVYKMHHLSIDRWSGINHEMGKMLEMIAEQEFLHTQYITKRIDVMHDENEVHHIKVAEVITSLNQNVDWEFEICNPCVPK